MEKEAQLYIKKEEKRVQCRNCSHYCLIFPGKRGICGVRKNVKGTLFSLNYGRVIALNIDPIEKKPLFHFLPGTNTLSLATVGCNFACLSCQNYDISQHYKEKEIPGEIVSPEEIVDIALKNRVPSISYTYTEPTVFSEYALDIMKEARKKGLKNVWVSNGFFSEETAEAIFPYLDSINIDLKSFSDQFYQSFCQARLEPILKNIQLIKKAGLWLEVTTLVVPGLSDSKEMFEGIAKFIKDKVGAVVPWHISKFSGEISWKAKDYPNTSKETLQKGYEIGKKIGLEYVYTGNISGLDLENTFCPKCKKIAIVRDGYSVNRYDDDGRCAYCEKDLNLILK